MYRSLTSIFLLLLFIPYQTPRDSIRHHYENAEAERRAGKLDAAQAEYEARYARRKTAEEAAPAESQPAEDAPVSVAEAPSAPLEPVVAQP